MYSFGYAQIQTLPEEITGLTTPKKQARMNTYSNKPFWIGTGGYPHIHFDSSDNHKIGIGVGHKSGGTVLSPLKFTEHAKVHIRHEGGSGSEFQNQKGPHLLLDEATSEYPAVVRFRQSTLETTGPGGGGAEIMTPGDRYWDIRGFANGATPSSDAFRIINSGLSEDMVNIDGNGDFKFEGVGNPRIQLKGPATAGFIGLELGVSGVGANGGKIWYYPINDEIQIFSGSDRTLSINNGFVKLGSNSSAPKIKTWLGTVTTSTTAGVGLNYGFLPATEDKILAISCMITGADGVTGQIYAFSIDGTTISFESLGSNYLGKEIRMFVTYTE